VCNRLAILASFVVAIGIIPGSTVGDPDPVCQWKFDGNANDSSAYSRNGTENGGPTYASGYDGQAIVLDGIDDYVVYSFAQQTWSAYTVAVWVRTDTLGQDQYSSVFNNNSSGADFQIDVDGADNYRYRGTAAGLFGAVSASWIHLAATCDGSNTTLYYNGISVGTVAAADTVFGRFAVGVNRNTANWFAGSVDDVRIYDRALSPAEIQALAPSGEATLLSPADGAMLGAASVLLEWRAGRCAASHNVYFGADSDSLTLVAENQPLDSNSFGPVALELGRTYYWSVDEVNDPCVWAGDIWSFETREYLVVDDFDSYVSTSGPNEPSLLSTWKDGSTNGTGSAISLEAEFAGSSMKYAYDNSESPFYSEAELAYDGDEDWTAGGVKAMALEFRGDVNNSGERLYVGLEYADGNSATVTYEGGGLVQESWQVWNIALRDFADEGVDLRRVKKLIIGVFGSGGSGALYVDDIRLYPPRCLPEYAVASLDGDCITDLGDLDVILRYWLAGDYDVAAAEPNEGRLLAHYRFDETAGLVAYDSSTRGNDAILDPNGGGAWDSCGYDGYCLDFDGTFAVSVPNDVFGAISNEVTISVWVHIDAKVNPNSIGRAEFGAGPVEPNEPWDRVAWIQDKPQDDLGRWSHYAFVKDADDGMMRIYHNGVLVAQNVDAFQPIDGAGAGRSTIGSRPDGRGGYEGKLDEFRVYDYALSDAEVLHLARGSGTELHQPLQPVLAPADPYEDGMITFRDFAILGEWWLRESLWP